ncbi:MAG: hypothetical protein HQL48_10690, partial [Gammaproteobacteria bacterium]|nr:hypothetical protein [Gammaproteobacteria bacterium]
MSYDEEEGVGLPPAYHPLCQRLGLTKRLPFTPNWTASADFIELIVARLLEQKPEHILECSSGLTTLIIARCCQLNGRGNL